MTAKEFIFSLDKDKLFRRFYDDFYKDDFLFEAQAKKDGFDDRKEEVIRKAFDTLLSDLKETKYIENTQYKLLPMAYYDYDMEDDLSHKITRSFDSCLLKIEDFSGKEPVKEVTSKEEISQKQLFETYAIMFISWDELMSYELLYYPDDEDDVYGSAADFLHELSWFGYDRKTAEENEAVEKQKLDEAVEEAKNPENLITLSADDLYDEFGIDRPSEQETALRNKLTDEIIVKNYNEKVRIYNKYIIGERK